MLKKSLIILTLMLIGLMGITSTTNAQDDTIAAWLRDSEDHTIIVEWLEATELMATLEATDVDVTFFAPTDDSITDTLDIFGTDSDEVLANGEFEGESLEAIVRNMFLEGSYTLAQLGNVQRIDTAQGSTIYTTTGDEWFNTRVRRAEAGGTFSIESSGETFSNGTVYAVEGFMLPTAPTIVNTFFVESDGSTSGSDESTTSVSSGAENTSDASAESTSASSENTCYVSTQEVGYVRVRVGPGTDRTILGALPAYENFEAFAQAVDSTGGVWYELDPEAVFPDSYASAAWVASWVVDSQGDCNDLELNQDAVVVYSTSSDGTTTGTISGGSTTSSTTSSGGSTGTVAGAPLALGIYYISWAEYATAQCNGRSVSVPVAEILSYSGTQAAVYIGYNGTNQTIDGLPLYPTADGALSTSFTIEGATGTLYIRPTSSVTFSGSFVTSYSQAGISCSASINFSAVR